MAKNNRQRAATALPIMMLAWMKSVQITALMPPSVVYTAVNAVMTTLATT